MSLTITIDRTSLSLADLVLSGTDDVNDYGITSYSPPALQARLRQLPDSDFIHGSEFTGGVWQQAILGFSWVPDHADDETDVQTAYAVVAAAIGQFEFEVTTQVGGAPAQVWQANKGSIQLAGGSRTYADVEHSNPVYSVTIPVYPIPGAL